VIILVLSAIMTGRLNKFLLDNAPKLPYLYPEYSLGTLNIAEITGKVFPTYYLLLNSLIPLSLIITIEISKMGYSKIIENDCFMTGIDQEIGGQAVLR
jgi:hypothetical protein